MTDETCCGACGYPIHATKDKACDWCRQSADRIEALTAKVKLMDDLDVINGEKIEALTEQLEAARADAKEAEAYAEELEAMNKNQEAMIRQADRRGDALEAELAKAVEALREIAGECGCSTARAVIAEIEGEKT